MSAHLLIPRDLRTVSYWTNTSLNGVSVYLPMQTSYLYRQSGVYMDGAHIIIQMCGTHVDGNQGNAYGGGFFFVDDATAGTAAIDQSSFDRNATAFAGGLYLQGATGTLTNSSVINNQVKAINGVGPYAMDAFFEADSLGSLSTDDIGP